MKTSKSNAISEEQLVGSDKAEDPTQASAKDQAGEMGSTPADDGPKHVPLPEATIEASLGGRFLFETPDGQWEGRITGRRSQLEGHWEVLT